MRVQVVALACGQYSGEGADAEQFLPASTDGRPGEWFLRNRQ
jgi:hypothetical protein